MPSGAAPPRQGYLRGEPAVLCNSGRVPRRPRRADLRSARCAIMLASRHMTWLTPLAAGFLELHACTYGKLAGMFNGRPRSARTGTLSRIRPRLCAISQVRLQGAGRQGGSDCPDETPEQAIDQESHPVLDSKSIQRGE